MPCVLSPINFQTLLTHLTNCFLVWGASFDGILAPQMERGSETIDRIQRLILQCSQRDQEFLLALIDKMLDTREKQEKK